MPQLDLTHVNGQELRQLLDSSRRRGDATLSYQILQEMAARRQTPAERRRAKGQRPPEPRTVEVDFTETAEADELPPMPKWLPPGVAEPPPPDEPPPLSDLSAPLRLADDDASPPLGAEDWDLRLRGAPSTRRARRETARVRGLPIFIIGMLAGVGVGWWGADIARDGWPGWGAQAAQAAPAAPAAPAASAAPPPAKRGLVVLAQAAAAPMVVVPVETKAPDQPPEAVPEPPIATVKPEPVTEAPPAPPQPSAPEIAEAAPDAPPPAEKTACDAEPTPADRAICGDPALRRLQRQLRTAYARALDAHEHRDLLRERQLAWRDARSDVSDPDRLARLYEERIRKLNAAAAQARGEQ